MNKETITESWEQILELTRQFKAFTGSDNWLEASELASLRHQRITQHFATFPVGPETAEFYFKHLKSFMHEEEFLQQEATAARKKAMKDGANMNNNKKALRAYSKIG